MWHTVDLIKAFISSNGYHLATHSTLNASFDGFMHEVQSLKLPKRVGNSAQNEQFVDYHEKTRKMNM